MWITPMLYMDKHLSVKCHLSKHEQVPSCWVVMILPFPLSQHEHTFFVKDDVSTRIALVFVRSNEQNEIRNVVSDNLKSVLVLRERKW